MLAAQLARCPQSCRITSFTEPQSEQLSRRLSNPGSSDSSGTRLAFDDAQTLFEAVVGSFDPVEQRLAAYQESRSPGAAKLVGAMEESYQWYESITDYMHLSPLDFAYSYMTRTGRIDDDRLRREHPQFMAQWEASQAETVS